MAPEDDRKKRQEDLFGELDRFFDEPANGHGAPEEPGGARPQGEAEEEELLPAGWLPDVDDLDLTDQPGTSSTDPRPGEPEPTAEMTGDEWSRLRDALGERPDEDESDAERDAGPRAEPRADELGADSMPEERLLGHQATAGPPSERDDDDDEPGELTLDDLKKAPAEYADLPGPRDQDPWGESEEEKGEASEEKPFDRPAWGEPGSDEEVWTDEQPPAPSWEETPEEDVLGDSAGMAGPGREPAWDETLPDEAHEAPAFEDVEAAADQMARGLRGGAEPEDEPIEDLRRGGRRTVRVGEPEAMMGPAWEEPGAAGMPSEVGPAWGGRNLPAALFTAVVLAAAALISLAVSPAAFAFVAGAVVLVGQAEFYSSLQRRGQQPATALGLVIGGMILAAAYLRGEGAMVYLLALGVALSFLWYMVAPAKAREGLLANVAGTILGIVYVPFLAAYLLVILSGPASPRALTLSVLGLTFLYDAAAFAIGSLWGSRALAPTISPRKSWEGLIGATIVVFIVAIALVSQVEPIDSVGLSLGLAVVVSVFAPLGDLAESALKRDLGVKDMGAILPGHGGILDRIDSVLFVAPAAFYFFRIFL